MSQTQKPSAADLEKVREINKYLGVIDGEQENIDEIVEDLESINSYDKEVHELRTLSDFDTLSHSAYGISEGEEAVKQREVLNENLEKEILTINFEETPQENKKAIELSFASASLIVGQFAAQKKDTSVFESLKKNPLAANNFLKTTSAGKIALQNIADILSNKGGTEEWQKGAEIWPLLIDDIVNSYPHIQQAAAEAAETGKVEEGTYKKLSNSLIAGTVGFAAWQTKLLTNPAEAIKEGMETVAGTISDVGKETWKFAKENQDTLKSAGLTILSFYAVYKTWNWAFGKEENASDSAKKEEGFWGKLFGWGKKGLGLTLITTFLTGGVGKLGEMIGGLLKDNSKEWVTDLVASTGIFPKDKVKSFMTKFFEGKEENSTTSTIEESTSSTPEKEMTPMEKRARDLWEKIDKKGIFEDLTGFVKDTAVSLKKDAAELTRFNEFFPGINLEEGAMETFMNYTPIALLKDLLEWGIGEEELLKWQEKGEKALWIGGGAFVGFKMLLGRNKKLYQTLGITFLVYGLCKKYEWAQETVTAPFKIPADAISYLPEEIQEAIKNRDFFGVLSSLEKLSPGDVPMMLVEGYGIGLLLAGKWIFIEPAKGYWNATKEFWDGNFGGMATAIVAGQLPIMVTAALLGKLKGNSAMQEALRVNLVRIASTRNGRLDVNMFFRGLAQKKLARGARYFVSDRMTTTTSRAHYLARKAAYYDRIKHPKKALAKEKLEDYVQVLAQKKDFIHGKEIPGIGNAKLKNPPGVIFNPARPDWTATHLFEQAKNWTNQPGVIARNTIDPLVEKTSQAFNNAKKRVKIKVTGGIASAKTVATEKASSTLKDAKDTAAQHIKEGGEKVKEKTTTYAKEKVPQGVEKSKEKIKNLGIQLERQVIELQAALVSGDKLTIENAKVKYEETRSQMKKIAKKIPSKEMVHIETGKFAKTALKGGILVFTTLSAARLTDFFMSEEVSSEEKTEMAKEIGKDLLPFVGTWRDRNRAIEEFANGEVSEAIKSTMFATLGAVSDVLLAAGVLTFGASSVAGGSLRAGITAMKTARNANTIKKIATGVTAGYAGMSIMGLSELAWDRISQKDDLILGELDEKAANDNVYDLDVAA